jgi:hypothetical protein
MAKISSTIKSNAVIIILLINLIICSKVCYDLGNIRNSTYTKSELELELQIMGLESESRMIESTDRTIYDLHRLDSIQALLKKLKNKRTHNK